MLLQTQALRSSPLGFACELCLVEYFDGGHKNKLVHEQSERGAADILPQVPQESHLGIGINKFH